MNDLDAAIIAYLTGDIDDAQFDELDRCLQQDAAAARRLAELCYHDLTLATVLRLKSSAISPTQAEARPKRVRVKKVARPSRWIPAAAAAVLLIGALLAWFRFSGGTAVIEPVVATVTAVQGAVQVRESNATALHALTVRASLHAKDELRVAKDAAVTFAYADGTTLTVGADAALTLGAATKRIVLDRGEISARVAPQPAGNPMLLSTPLAQAEVVGTQLKLSAASSETRLDVTEGKVCFTRQNGDHAAVMVAAGFTAAASADATHALTLHTLKTLKDDLPGQAQTLLDVVFAERPAQWGGEFATPPDAPDGAIAIRSNLFTPGTRFYGEIRAPQFPHGFAAGAQTYLRFRYRTEGLKSGDLIKFMLKKSDETIFHGFIQPEFDHWAVATVRLDGNFMNLEGKARPLTAGEMLDNIVFLGAAPDGTNAHDGPKLWLDEMIVFTAPGEMNVSRVEQL